MEVKSFQYDGRSFVASDIQFTGGSFGRGVAALRTFKLNGEDLIGNFPFIVIFSGCMLMILILEFCSRCQRGNVQRFHKSIHTEISIRESTCEISIRF